ncbi:MAG: SIS domain-containing protein [Rhodospirillaceae bacterium]|jgi:phosphoheptose isomerase|nr:SIS domain-containing protein [Rhodospirillaceae bacterium]MBT3886572.1 SIS domain-containing protein [Rhodospirillaceae bacterium]MBT4118888.1 SIS domain-containing protein [Rhodospirillaceae bacterium]MBT4672706.1 SIS domain-containing protein [Rhodospirillaceae bacterium]MBT4717817.1 SIS domain-containing protein [Rhodospirillaceae bacterium]
MSFPDTKFSDAGAYVDAYFDQYAKAARSVERGALGLATEILRKAYEGGATLFVCGNGGSASISNHLACDHGKLLATDTDLLPRVQSLAANVEVITAIANDISYDEVFVHQLKLQAGKGDVVMTVSSSGDSENVVRAASWARDNGLEVISLTGFEGGRTAKLASVNLHVTADNYGIIEDVHQSLMHLMGQYLRQARMDEALIVERKF